MFRNRRVSTRRGGGRGMRIIIALGIVVVSLITYFSSQQYNPVTGEKQYVDLSPEQEIALGLQAAPEMAAQHGGLDPDPELQAQVDRVGGAIVERTAARETPYQYDFHVLDDPETVNAFALPGGQIFITEGLLRLLETEGQLAGVLGHEIGHVVARHSAEHLAKAKLTQGLTGAAVLATYDPDNPSSVGAGQLAAMIGQMVNMKFGRDDEIESDRLGVRFVGEAGYDPTAMIEVMHILDRASQGQRSIEFFSTHPNPERRIQNIEEAIRKQFPSGVPSGLIP